MNSSDDLAERLTALGINVLRQSRTTDIDCYTERPLGAVASDLEASGLIVTKQRDTFIECVFIDGDRLVPVEVATTLFRGAAFRRFGIKKDFVDKYVSDPQQHEATFRILKSALCLTGLRVLSDLPAPNVSSVLSESLVPNPYRTPIRRWDYPSSFSLLLHNAKVSSVIDRYVTLASNIIFHWKASRTFAIVGPDGAGKSTLIAALTRYTALKPVYMGMRDFRSQKLIVILQRVRYVSIPVVHVIIFIEYWSRLVNSWCLRLRGFDIVFDRYPTFDYAVSPSIFDRMFGRIVYGYLFPAPGRMFLLAVPPEIIHARKQEMSPADAETFYRRADGQPVIRVNNTGAVRDAVTSILKQAYRSAGLVN